jgi:polar amino acid transport system permease protein
MGFGTVLAYWDVLWSGLRMTLLLSFVAIVGGTLLGLVVGLLLTSKLVWIRAPFRLYVNLFRGTPPLIHLFMIYLGLPSLGVALTVLSAAIISFILYTGAYVAEVFRAGIEAVPSGQTDAALSLGLSYPQRMLRIILPQTVRLTTPALASFYLSLIKDTSLASIIGVSDLVSEGQAVIAATQKPFQTYLVIAATYFCICFPVSRIVSRIERRARRNDQYQERIKTIRKRAGAERSIAGDF